jgi:hypothetical protein
MKFSIITLIVVSILACHVLLGGKLPEEELTFNQMSNKYGILKKVDVAKTADVKFETTARMEKHCMSW